MLRKTLFGKALFEEEKTHTQINYCAIYGVRYKSTGGESVEQKHVKSTIIVMFCFVFFCRLSLCSGPVPPAEKVENKRKAIQTNPKRSFMNSVCGLLG